ncbi:MAG: protein-export chaperone SecB [Oscillospiraceae bacterium]|nr:protein-export chaperone SecB [Oscillospiraceae bacterium]
MVSVTLLSQRMREVHFVNRIDKNGQIQLTSGFNFKVSYSADNTKCIATLYQSAQLKEDPDRLFLSGEIVGTFALQGIVDEETKRDAHIQCYDQLFPFLQSAVSQLANAAGLPGFLLRKNPMKRQNITLATPPANAETK